MTRRLVHRADNAPRGARGDKDAGGARAAEDAGMSIDWDEAKHKTMKGIQVGENLERLSIGELEARIAAFEAEVVRVRAEITRKKAHEAAAASLFKR